MTDERSEGMDRGTPEIVRRKSDHVQICLRDDIQASVNHWDQVHLVHAALPEVDLGRVDTATELFGNRLGAPLVIAAMTGGHEHGAEINDRLAAAAAEHRIAMGVGSQRAALEHPEQAGSFRPLLDHDIPLVIANIGAPQLVDQDSGAALGPSDAVKAMEMVNADMVAVHLNFLQEVVQPEGDTRAEGVIEAIALLCEEVPVIVKETGAGISHQVALELREAGVSGIDTGGAGGTSFAAVEAVRSEERGLAGRASIGWTFRDWGIPTPVSVVEAQVGVPIIATGGIRNGLDVAKALVLGASAAGTARAVLPGALAGREEASASVGLLVEGLRTAMFLVGAATVEELAVREFVMEEGLVNWIARFEEGD